MIRVIDVDGDEFFFWIHDLRRASVRDNSDESNRHNLKLYFHDEAEFTLVIDDDAYAKLTEVLMTEE